MAITQEQLGQHTCPQCGCNLLAPAAENKETKQWRDTIVWCADMGHWAGTIKDSNRNLVQPTIGTVPKT